MGQYTVRPPPFAAATDAASCGEATPQRGSVESRAKAGDVTSS
jgi:hypothetical protein